MEYDCVPKGLPKAHLMLAQIVCLETGEKALGQGMERECLVREEWYRMLDIVGLYKLARRTGWFVCLVAGIQFRRSPLGKNRGIQMLPWLLGPGLDSPCIALKNE